LHRTARRIHYLEFGMKKRPTLQLLALGAGWFVVAGVVGYAVPVFGSLWFQNLVCCILTVFVVGA
jgi:hypothetical protein